MQILPVGATPLIRHYILVLPIASILTASRLISFSVRTSCPWAPSVTAYLRLVVGEVNLGFVGESLKPPHVNYVSEQVGEGLQVRE